MIKHRDAVEGSFRSPVGGRLLRGVKNNIEQRSHVPLRELEALQTVPRFFRGGPALSADERAECGRYHGTKCQASI
jgi:hypothetical protein